jgi:hypothetical protein
VITDFNVGDEDIIEIDVLDPTAVTVDDTGANVVLDFGFGTVEVTGVTGGGTFGSVDDINDALGFEAVTFV